MDPLIQMLFQVFGPSGVLLGLGIMAMRSVLPWLKEYLQAQTAATLRIADAVEKMESWQHGVNLRLDRIERLSDGTSRDITGIYAILGEQQPSEKRRRAAATARHDRQARERDDE